MRNLILSLPLLLAAVPAAAQTYAVPMPPAPVDIAPTGKPSHRLAILFACA